MSPLLRAILLTSIFFVFGCPLMVNAKFLAMRPLSARDVYRILMESGHSDAIPQGRVITQGLAAMTGFAVGLKKAMGAVFLYDVITANVTGLDLNSTSSSSSSSSSSILGSNILNNVNSRGSAVTTEEVCFNSRSARSLEEAEAIAEAYSRDDDKKKIKLRVRSSDAERHLTRKRRNKRKKPQSQKRRKPSRLLVKKSSQRGTGAEGSEADDIGTDSMTETTSPTLRTDGGAMMAENSENSENSGVIEANDEAMPIATATASGTNVDNNEGTGTTEESTTSTDNDRAINCVVIEKPTAK